VKTRPTSGRTLALGGSDLKRFKDDRAALSILLDNCFRHAVGSHVAEAELDRARAWWLGLYRLEELQPSN
jgi:hypothetical protein